MTKRKSETPAFGEAVDMPDEVKEEQERPPFEILEAYMFTTKDGRGDEGVAAVVTPQGQLVPLIAFDAQKVEQMMTAAQQIADETKTTIRVIRLFNREELGTIEPRLVQPVPANTEISETKH